MKHVLIFICCIVVGFVGTYLLIAQKTTKDIVKPTSQKSVSNSSRFSLEKAPSLSLHGDITSLSGTVKWQSRTATESSVISSPQLIQQGEIIETDEDGKVSVAFPDMLISLSPSTSLEIVQSLPSDVILEQKEGEIAYSNSSSSPLEIRVSPLLVQSNKNNFIITKDINTGTITVKVLSGTVKAAFNDDENVTTVETIPEKKTFIFDTETRTSRIK